MPVRLSLALVELVRGEPAFFMGGFDFLASALFYVRKKVLQLIHIGNA